MTRHLDRRTTVAWLSAFLLLAAAGCAGIGPSPKPGGTPVPQPSSRTWSEAELRLLLLEQLGPLWYCDRDAFPAARDEQEAALAGYAAMVADTQLFPPVAATLGIDPSASHTDAEKLELYRLWKMAQAVQLDPIGNDAYRFDYLARPVGGASDGTRTGGVVDEHGTITVEQRAAAGAPMCPICLSVGTLIETIGGAVPVDRLRIGDPVWTLNRAGTRVVGRVIALGSTTAPAGHRVIRVTLADGRTVTASPGHPVTDGRTIGGLRVGDGLDGSLIASLETLPYVGKDTYDLAVSGESGLYFAGGIPLGSTLD